MLALTRNEAFQKDMATALKIYRSHSKNNAKIAECNYLLGRVACLEGKAEGVDLMESSSALFLKMGNYIESLRVGFELLSFLEGDEHKYEVVIPLCRCRWNVSSRSASDISQCGHSNESPPYS